jgi:hypothetical protein
MQGLPPDFDISKLPPGVADNMPEAKDKKRSKKRSRKHKRAGRAAGGDSVDDDSGGESAAARQLRERDERETRDWDTMTQEERDEVTARRAREKRAGELAAAYERKMGGSTSGRGVDVKDL